MLVSREGMDRVNDAEHVQTLQTTFMYNSLTTFLITIQMNYLVRRKVFYDDRPSFLKVFHMNIHMYSYNSTKYL